MLVTVSGITMDIKLSQLSKASELMLSPLVNTTVCKLYCGMYGIINVGIVAEVIALQSLKAVLHMRVTPFPMITEVKPQQ